MEANRKAQVVMLPTVKPLKIGQILTYTDDKDTRFLPLATKAGAIWDKTKNKGYVAHELYFTSDDEIKEGDWVSDSTKIGKVFFSNSTGYSVMWGNNFNVGTGDYDYHNLKEIWFKIIATTDKSLKVSYVINHDPLELSSHTNLEVGTKSLPQPSQAFIKKYCKLGGINEVLIEYITINRCCGRCVSSIDECVSDTFCEVHNKLGCEDCFGKSGNITKLKVDSHNTITIHPIKDSWNKEEVIELCKLAALDSKYFIKNQEDWIKKNL